jgi:type IV pilus assembly protein PilV
LGMVADHHRGFSLIEVLVALLVLSIGLLGLAALQTFSLQYNTGSYYRTQATFLAYEIIDRMRINGAAIKDADGSGYDVPTAADLNTVLTTYNACVSSTCRCDTAQCASSDLAAYDVGKWYDKIVATLPNARNTPPTIQVGATKLTTITIRWAERDLQMSQTWAVQL